MNPITFKNTVSVYHIHVITTIDSANSRISELTLELNMHSGQRHVVAEITFRDKYNTYIHMFIKIKFRQHNLSLHQLNIPSIFIKRRQISLKCLY